MLLSLPASAADSAEAAKLIETTAAEVIGVIKNTTPGPARQAAIQKALRTSFDLPYMGQAALGSHWAKANEAQRDRFLKATTGVTPTEYRRLNASAV